MLLSQSINSINLLIEYRLLSVYNPIGAYQIVSNIFFFTDVTPPPLSCSLPGVQYASGNDVVFSTAIYVTTNDYTANLDALPSTVTLSYANIGLNPIITYIATDLSGNIASCQSQMRIAGT